MKARPTDAEFEELKRQRDAELACALESISEKWGCDPAGIHVHDCGSAQCCCACPEGPRQHVWNGPEYTEDNFFSVTCSRCGTLAIYRDNEVWAVIIGC